jgi:hypothetical protein
MDALQAFVRKVDAIERISGERPREITLHPHDYDDIVRQVMPLIPPGWEPPTTAALVDGVLVKTDPCQTRLRRE